GALAARGALVGVVDADLGQSEIGPPTAVGLGRVVHPLGALEEAELIGLSFVGAISPAGHVEATVAGTGRMSERAFAAGLDRVIVDTSGLIDGELGRCLKRRKIERLDPDLVIALERGRECAALLGQLPGPERPEVLRLPVAEGARRRSIRERRRHREAAFDTYFEGAEPRRLALSDLAFRAGGDRRAGAVDARDCREGMLVGLEDFRGDTLGLGVVRAVDVPARTLLLDTPVRDAPVAGVRLGSHSFHPAVSVR
ncbi:MAG TPA: Clp1/GlmU family protein, partial [Candidatus Methylomirabilis sp.]|nr:Clp1/GlmU family protein [Candidatus Methylomirabilis sp.]